MARGPGAPSKSWTPYPAEPHSLEDLARRYGGPKRTFSGNPLHLQVLHEALRRRSGRIWARWRRAHPNVVVNLRGVNLAGRTLRGIDWHGARLDRAVLTRADLRGANLEHASFLGASLAGADLSWVRATGVKFRAAVLNDAKLSRGTFEHAILTGAGLSHANLNGANFSHALLKDGELYDADLTDTNFNGANLISAQLDGAILHRTSLLGAKLGGASVGLASIRQVRIDSTTKQRGLIADVHVMLDRPRGDAVMFKEVNDIRLAQFHGAIEEYGAVANLIAAGASEVVLILGRFSPKRKRVLKQLADALSKRGKVPVIYDFPSPAQRELSDTVRFIAGMSQFIVVDLTSASSVPLELQATIPDLMIPVLPIIETNNKPFAMLADLQRRYFWVQRIVSYRNGEELVRFVDKAIIERAESAAEEIALKRTAALRPAMSVRHARAY